MLKVCHLTSVHQFSDPRIFHKECCSLSRNGYDVTLIVPNAECSTISGVKIISFPAKTNSRFRRMLFTVNRIYREACKVDADIYHLHDPELLRIAYKLKKRGKKVIYDSHEFYSLQILERNYIPLLLRNLISGLYSIVETYICRRIDAVVQVCTVGGEDYFKGRCKKSIYLPNTPLLSDIIPEIPTNVIKSNSVVYVGSLTYERGITHLIEASSYTDFRIELVGNFGSDEYKRCVMRNLDNSNVTYLGFIPNKDINSLLVNRCAGISTLLNIGQYSKIDTLPTKVYEYLLAGIPVILSDTKFNRAFIEKYNCGICVNPSNPKEIADAINFLCKDTERASQMGTNGRIAVLDNFNWKHQEETLLGLYKII